MRKSSCDGSRIARMVAQAMSKSGGGAAVLNSCSNVFGKYEVFTLSKFAEKKWGGHPPAAEPLPPELMDGLNHEAEEADDLALRLRSCFIVAIREC